MRKTMIRKELKHDFIHHHFVSSLHCIILSDAGDHAIQRQGFNTKRFYNFRNDEKLERRRYCTQSQNRFLRIHKTNKKDLQKEEIKPEGKSSGQVDYNGRPMNLSPFL